MTSFEAPWSRSLVLVSALSLGILVLVGFAVGSSVPGFFRNRTLGRYRAYATDPGRAVVLVLGGRTVVVTPGEPRIFLQLVAPGVVLSEPPAGAAPPAREGRAG